MLSMFQEDTTLERYPVAPSYLDSERIVHDFDTLRSAASRAQDAADRFKDHTMALYTRPISSFPALSGPQLRQGTKASISAGPVSQCQNVGSHGYWSSHAVAQDIDTSTCESAADPSAEPHSELSKYQGSTSVIKTNNPMGESKSLIDLLSPPSGFLTPTPDEKEFLTSTITRCSDKPDAWKTTQIPIDDPSLKSNVSSCTPNTADDSNTLQQGTGTMAGAKKKGRPLGSKNKKKHVQPRKNPSREMVFGLVDRKGERTRRSKLPVAENPGDDNVRQNGGVRHVTVGSTEAPSVGSSHAQLIDHSQKYPDSRGSQSLPPNTVSRVPKGPWLESQHGSRVVPAPGSHYPLSPQIISSSVKTSYRARVPSLQDSAAISAAFQSEILPIIRQACLPFRHTLSTSALHAIERECAEKVISLKLFKALRKNEYHLSSMFEKRTRAIVDTIVQQRTNTAISEGLSKNKVPKGVLAADTGKDKEFRLRAISNVKSPRHVDADENQDHTISPDPHLALVAPPDVGPSRLGPRFAHYAPTPSQPIVLRGTQTSPVHEKLVHYVPQTRTMTLPSLLRHRELGNCPKGSSTYQIRQHVTERLTYWRTWTGASKDVLVAAWAPDGSTFAVGGSTDLDDLNLQYNRHNNLLYGNLDDNTLHELPNHYVERPKPENVQHGENARQATYDSVDPELYTTVTSVCFSTQGDHMFTASYDKTVKIWDISIRRKPPTYLRTIEHSAQVEQLALSQNYGSVLATGQNTTDDSIRIYNFQDWGDSQAPMATYSSSRARKLGFLPTALQWGLHPNTGHLLLAGYTENKSDTASADREGDLCLWNVEVGAALKLYPAAQSVFDVCWHHSLPLFAAATTPGSARNLTDRFNTRSVIRTYRPLETPSRIMEYECPAFDINDLKFHPYDDHYVSAGCTNGITYVWDFRMPDQILHKLRHGSMIDEIDGSRSREEQDTGIRLSLWDQGGQLLYTGSSDGTIKAWNIYRSTEDALVRDVAQFDSSVMCGAFSPDYTNLLVGSSKGAVHILSTSPTTHPPDDDDSLKYHEGPYETITYIPSKQLIDVDEERGIDSSRRLLASKHLTMHPVFGAGQGPRYNGPYAAYAHPLGGSLATTELLPDIRATQLDSYQRKLGRKAGGQVDSKEKQRYREQEKLAYARYLKLNGHRDEEGREKRGRESEGEGEGEGEAIISRAGIRKKSRGMVDISGILQEHVYIDDNNDDGDEGDRREEDTVMDDEVADSNEEDYWFY